MVPCMYLVPPAPKSVVFAQTAVPAFWELLPLVLILACTNNWERTYLDSPLFSQVRSTYLSLSFFFCILFSLLFANLMKRQLSTAGPHSEASFPQHYQSVARFCFAPPVSLGNHQRHHHRIIADGTDSVEKKRKQGTVAANISWRFPSASLVQAHGCPGSGSRKRLSWQRIQSGFSTVRSKLESGAQSSLVSRNSAPSKLGPRPSPHAPPWRKTPVLTYMKCQSMCAVSAAVPIRR